MNKGRLLLTGLLGHSHQEFTLACGSVGCYLVAVQGPCRLPGHAKWMMKQQYHGVVGPNSGHSGY